MTQVVKLEGSLYIAFISHTILIEEGPFYCHFERRLYFLASFGGEDPFYWLFERSGNGLFTCIYLVQTYAPCRLGVHFYGPCSTWRAGRRDQVILLVRTK